jgi:6-phosphogluconolactonase
MKSKLLQYSSLEELSIAASKLVMSRANEAIRSRGVFRIALAGGSTPKHLYEILSSEKYINQTDWSAWKIYFGDERIVPPSDDRSNYAMAAESLLKHVPIKENNIYTPLVDLPDPETIAVEYEALIRRSFDNSVETPRLDLMLLGLGSDGHTASLFPGKPSLNEQTHLIVATTHGVLPPHVDRITFTLPFINAARHVVFLVSGNDKTTAFQAAYNGTAVKAVPAYYVQPSHGDVQWFITDELISSA